MFILYVIFWCVIVLTFYGIYRWTVNQVREQNILTSLPVAWKLTMYEERDVMINEFTSKVCWNSEKEKITYYRNINIDTYPITNAILKYAKGLKNAGWRCEKSLYQVCKPKSTTLLPQGYNVVLVVKPDIYQDHGEWRSLICIDTNEENTRDIKKQDMEGLLSFTFPHRSSHSIVNSYTEPILCIVLDVHYLKLSDSVSIPPFLRYFINKMKL